MIHPGPETLVELWENVVARFPRKPAFFDLERTLTYAEADDIVSALAANVRDRLGVKERDTVALCMQNSIEYCLAYWATARLGAIAVPVNIRLGPEEMTHVFRSSRARVAFLGEDVRAIAENPARQGGIERLVSVGSEACEVSFDSLVTAGARTPPEPAVSAEDVAIVMHTSGTTGRPKGAVMRGRDIMFNIRHAVYAHSFRFEDVHLLVVPMFHCTAMYSLLPSSAYLGSSIAVGVSRPEIPQVVSLIQRAGVTTFIGVPMMFNFLLIYKDLASYDLSSLRLIAYAGARMPPATIRRLRERFPGVELHNFFGLTETISMTHVLPSKDALEKADSVGVLLPEVFQRIVDEEGRDVAPGEVGELCFHRSNVVVEYWNEPGRLEESFMGDWFRSGDFASADEDGYTYIKGRKKEMIIVGGENVYAQEVENVITRHDKVLEAAVKGVPATGIREHLGEVVKAFVVLRRGEESTAREIMAHCARGLARYKVPQQVVFMADLPRNPAGKVLKRALK